MDFTFKTYENLLNTLLSRGFSFLTFAQYIEAKFHTKRSRSASSIESLNLESSNLKSLNLESLNFESSNLPAAHSKVGLESLNFESLNLESSNLKSLNLESLNFIILRHDVEARYPNALKMAEIEHKLGIKGSYYFRIFPKEGNEAIIKQIAALGHEIGYHYDDLTHCNGDHEKAILRFQKNLSYLRQFGPVTTITMEGAPLSKYDNRDLWKQALTPQIIELVFHKSTNQPLNESSNPQILKSLNFESLNLEFLNPTIHYSLFSILAEPYLDLDFNQVLYLTDTGRRWDGYKVSVRDKIPGHQERWNELGLTWHTTPQLISAINNGQLPDQVMMTFHPQRWTDNKFQWAKELVLQQTKNVVKSFIVK